MQILWTEILTHIVGFLLLLFVLRRVLWKPLLAQLDARRTTIATGLADVARAKADIERLQAGYTARLARVEDEARGHMREATLEGKRIATEIQDHARAEARKIVEEMKGKLHLEIAQAKVELRDQIAALVIESTQRLLRERVDVSKDKQLVTQFLDEIQAKG